MRAVFRKETLQDPEKKGQTYTNYTLLRNTEFCCELFKEYCKKFTGWSYEKGRFAIVDQITYEGHSVSVINFCPFCGQKIEYEDVDKPKKSRKQKSH